MRGGTITNDQLSRMAKRHIVELHPSVNATLINVWNKAIAHAGIPVFVYSQAITIKRVTEVITVVHATATSDFDLGISGAANGLVNGTIAASGAAGVLQTLYNSDTEDGGASSAYILAGGSPLLVTTTSGGTGQYRVFMEFELADE